MPRIGKADPDYAVVWALDEVEELIVTPPQNSPFEIEQVFAFRPSIVTPRIQAQAGWFTIHPMVWRTLRTTEYARKKSLDGLATLQGKITKIMIHYRYFKNFRWSLDTYGINDATVFPDLSGVAKYTHWYHTLEADEE